jgi:sialic acid synthase
MPYVIAEVGCNHKGDFALAKEYIRVAKEICGADIVKFQKRSVSELLTKEEYNAPHPVPHNSYGKTYGEHRDNLEFTIEQHRELKDYADLIGIEYSCSVWDLTSAKEIVSLNPSIIKIPSPCNLSFDMLKFIFDNYKGQVHISLGMTTKREESMLRNFIIDNNKMSKVVVYSCTSGYPVEFKDVCLKEILRIQDHWSGVAIGFGFSGHHRGIAIDCIAVAFEVDYIERHITFSRDWKGTDHSAALEIDGFRKLVRNIRASEEALGYKDYDILEVEKLNRIKLKRNITKE